MKRPALSLLVLFLTSQMVLAQAKTQPKPSASDDNGNPVKDFEPTQHGATPAQDVDLSAGLVPRVTVDQCAGEIARWWRADVPAAQIPVIAPDGTRGTIDATDLKLATAQGFKLDNGGGSVPDTRGGRVATDLYPSYTAVGLTKAETTLDDCVEQHVKQLTRTQLVKAYWEKSALQEKVMTENVEEAAKVIKESDEKRDTAEAEQDKRYQELVQRYNGLVNDYNLQLQQYQQFAQGVAQYFNDVQQAQAQAATQAQQQQNLSAWQRFRQGMGQAMQSQAMEPLPPEVNVQVQQPALQMPVAHNTVCTSRVVYGTTITTCN